MMEQKGMFEKEETIIIFYEKEAATVEFYSLMWKYCLRFCCLHYPHNIHIQTQSVMMMMVSGRNKGRKVICVMGEK